MTLICKATYDVLIPGYSGRTQQAYLRWRASHSADLAQIEGSTDFREQRAEALRELTPLPLGSGQATGATATAVSECANLMPPALRAPVGPLTSPGAGSPAAAPPAYVNRASVKVKLKQVIRSAPTPVGGALAPPNPQ